MSSAPSSHRPVSSFQRYWLLVTAAGALLVSLVDAALLQRTKSYFTGGFLAEDHLTGPASIAAFTVVSLLADAAIVGLLAAAIIWILARAGVGARASALAAMFFGVGPLLVADVVSYELASYFGDLLDLSLSMELAGGSFLEMLAVSSGHILIPVLLVLGAGGVAGGLVWLANRYAGGDERLAVTRGNLVVPIAVALIGLVGATAASAASDALENGLRRKPSGKVLSGIAWTLSDVDRDGFGATGRMRDPAVFDASVFPYAIDVPGNGIDENGVAGDLSPGPPYVERPPLAGSWARRPDVVLIVLESFRADMVGGTHDGRPITPVLDGLAARGASTRHAYSHNGYTAPSRYHIFSGSLSGERDGRTLVDDFKAQGYFVGYFSGQDESFGNPEFQVGFDRADVAYDARQDEERRYTTFTTPGSLAVPFGVVLERIGEFLDGPARTPQPLFLYVNFHDTHFPYTHDDVDTLVSPTRLARGEIVPRRRDELRAMYANTAANVDRAVGEVIAAVERARGAPPAVIVTADHGESLFEEGFLGHGYALDDVQTRIPLVVADLPMVIEEPFAQRDLRDAILAAMQVPPEQPAAPTVVAPEGRKVFQYLGNVPRPRQIAFLGAEGRSIYDFRSRQFRSAHGPWHDVDDLDGALRAEFVHLVNAWERMVLARAGK